MKVAIGFKSYDGFGGPAKMNYRLCDLKYTNGSSKAKIYSKEIFDLKEIDLEINVKNFVIGDVVMSVIGENINGYGRVELEVTDDNGICGKLAKEEIERARLRTINKETPNYFKKEYGDIANIDQIAKINLNDNLTKEQKHDLMCSMAGIP